MDVNNAAKIILNAVKVTEVRWKQSREDWQHIDDSFLRRAYEQGGFEFYKFYPLMKDNGIANIGEIGSILDTYQGPSKYRREFAGSYTSPFYEGLKAGEFGNVGEIFLTCVLEFKGRKGMLFWNKLWQLLVCCHDLKIHYDASFKKFILRKYSSFRHMPNLSEEDLLNTPPELWDNFKKRVRPWDDLYGVGENIFDYILGDCKDAEFARDSYKLDSANMHFLKVTGIGRLVGDITHDRAVQFIKSLNLPYTVREINTGIYHYCAEGESQNFGYCRNEKKCQECKVNAICERNFTLDNSRQLHLPTK